jgi:hypothetical protein
MQTKPASGTNCEGEEAGELPGFKCHAPWAQMDLEMTPIHPGFHAGHVTYFTFADHPDGVT